MLNYIGIILNRYMGSGMKQYIFKETQFEKEYQYIFLCGTKYKSKDVANKRNVLREFLKNQEKGYCPIILEDNFIFGRDSERYLKYDDIYMADLYQVEMLMNYLADCNMIIHESISTGAEIGLFLSEAQALDKTCLIVPDEFAVEEDKIGGFMKGAFLRGEKVVKVITYYPRLHKDIKSDEVSSWHTYFYQDKIGHELGKQILNFAEMTKVNYGIKFVKDKSKVQNGDIHFNCTRDKKELHITLKPRVLMLCIAALFNIDEVSREIFSSEGKLLKDYINYIADWLKKVFINTIEEKCGGIYNTCSIHLSMRVTGVYLSTVVGMCMYLFQAAGFIKIRKDQNYGENGYVTISRKMVENTDGTKDFFYKKYETSVGAAVDTQIK